MPKILIVEDDPDLRRGMSLSLARDGHEVFETDQGETALDLVLAKKPDVVILDVGLPGINGFEVCRRLRESGSDVVVMFLSERGDEIDRVVGLEIGAEDYVIKPFSIRELQARIHVRLGRPAKNPRISRYRFGDVEIDFDALQAKRKGKPLHLTSKEFEMLRMLIRHRGALVKREQMLADLWGYKDTLRSRTLDAHINKLRKKIETNPHEPTFIIAVYGEGYRFLG